MALMTAARARQRVLSEGSAMGLTAALALLWSGGLRLVLIGWALYGLGGGFDFVWHSLFGFEVTYDAVLSPSHIWLALAFNPRRDGYGAQRDCLANAFGTSLRAPAAGRDARATPA